MCQLSVAAVMIGVSVSAAAVMIGVSVVICCSYDWCVSCHLLQL